MGKIQRAVNLAVVVELLVLGLSYSAIAQVSGGAIQEHDDTSLDRMMEQFNSARGTRDETVTTAQTKAAMFNRARGGDMRARALLAEIEATAQSANRTIRWAAVATDASPITCIVSPSVRQIIWKGKFAEMNPSLLRWRSNCEYFSPAVQPILKEQILAARKRAEEHLRDPEAARYRNVRIYSSGSRIVLCGEINVKNGFGGYVGYSRFIASSRDAVLGTGDGVIEVASEWGEVCVNNANYRRRDTVELAPY